MSKSLDIKNTANISVRKEKEVGELASELALLYKAEFNDRQNAKFRFSRSGLRAISGKNHLTEEFLHELDMALRARDYLIVATHELYCIISISSITRSRRLPKKIIEKLTTKDSEIKCTDISPELLGL